jgi:hypothetical protein
MIAAVFARIEPRRSAGGSIVACKASLPPSRLAPAASHEPATRARQGGFLLRLQPFFQAGEVIFRGPRQKFEPLIKELLGFPYGHDDVLNALAYVLEIKPGEAIHPRFGSEHVIDAMPPGVLSHGRKNLLIDSDGRHTVAILIALYQERTFVIADWLESSAPGLVTE